jgi:hypothetical protein
VYRTWGIASAGPIIVRRGIPWVTRLDGIDRLGLSRTPLS